MKPSTQWWTGTTLVFCGIGLLPLSLQAAEPAEVRQHAEESFDRLAQADGPKASTALGTQAHRAENRSGSPTEQYLIGRGQGDLAKGIIVCQRVSELSARTDLAKQIRILVKEHMVDRVRERGGKEAEQDIEVTREEIVQEYLQGVAIIDRRVDEEKKLCTATAVMPKSQIQPKPAPDHPDPAISITR
jgi:hypothetical protein